MIFIIYFSVGILICVLVIGWRFLRLKIFILNILMYSVGRGSLNMFLKIGRLLIRIIISVIWLWI